MRIIYSLFLVFTLNFHPCFAEVRLPHLISEGMVLQRNQPLKLWGWADPGEEVQIYFLKQTKKTIADIEGNWEIHFPAQTAGGPYSLSVGETFRFSDVYIGDVWVCSGQSNMETTMSRIEPRFPDEVASAYNPKIRYFDVQDGYNFDEKQEDVLGGKWVPVSREFIENMAAVPYFFAKEIEASEKIPIGMINASVGGSPIQAWLDEAALKHFPTDLEQANKFRDASYIRSIDSTARANSQKWIAELYQKDAGYTSDQIWYVEDLNLEGWERMDSVDLLPLQDNKPVPGVFWFRKTFELDEIPPSDKVRLEVGTLIDSDSTYINGKFVGTTGYQYPPRRYDVPTAYLKKGENILTVRLIAGSGRGGFVTDKPYRLHTHSGMIDLSTEWYYRQGAQMPSTKSSINVRNQPIGLYNAMMAPVQKFPITGALWYQGESNTNEAEKYTAYFERLIKGWRDAWEREDLPVLFVQLPNFGPSVNEPQESNWAKFRETQRQALIMPHTGMAITIDVGEWNDIHPLDKETVGKRLSLLARRMVYDESDLLASGPLIRNIEKEGTKLILNFDYTGTGLQLVNGLDLNGFAVASEEGTFNFLPAEIQNDQVIINLPDNLNVKKVRYAWADNPDKANLANSAGLPASPFEYVLEK